MKKEKLLFILCCAVFIVGVVLYLESLGAGHKGVGAENFQKPVQARSGKAFGKNKQLTFELSWGGTFAIEGNGVAVQKSASYEDMAIIRSTDPLPETYSITVVAGQINYGLENVKQWGQAPSSEEDVPGNENGCYLIAIADREPRGVHPSSWWRRHRKLVIEVHNNVWGSGMPFPLIMAYFDKHNEMVSWRETQGEWREGWEKALEYDPGAWYRFDLEKTKEAYLLSISTEDGFELAHARVPLEEVRHSEAKYPEYFVTGDPYDNYYQGSYKIKSITLRADSF